MKTILEATFILFGLKVHVCTKSSINMSRDGSIIKIGIDKALPRYDTQSLHESPGSVPYSEAGSKTTRDKIH